MLKSITIRQKNICLNNIKILRPLKKYSKCHTRPVCHPCESGDLQDVVPEADPPLAETPAGICHTRVGGYIR